MAIPAATIEEIKGRTDLADLISSYGVPVRRMGADYKACCPFHHEKTPSFVIHPDKGYYHCFGCGESGSVFDFVMKQEGLTFVEAVKKLAQQCGVKIEEKEDPQAGLRILLLLDLHAALLRELLHGLDEGQPLLLHHEVEDGPAFAAAEAVVVALVGMDDEARRLLVVERAARLVVRPHPPHGDAVGRNQVGEVGPALDLLDCRRGDRHYFRSPACP